MNDKTKEELRKSIQVTTIKKEEEKPVVKANEETEVETEAEEVEVETKASEAETTIDDNKETIENNETEQERLEKEQSNAKTQQEKDRIQKRIDRLTAKNTNLQKENSDLKKQLAEKPKEGLTEEEVERRANQRMVDRKFADACNSLFDDAKKIDKNFETKINAVVEELGGLDAAGIPGSMIGVLEDIPNGGAVLNFLADNVDDYEDIRDLPLPKMASRLVKIGAKLEEEAKPKPKKISNAPKPMEGIGGSRSSPSVLTGKEDMSEYARIRAEQREQRRKTKQALMR